MSDHDQTGLTVVNFAHPITPTQREQIEQLTGLRLRNVLELRAEFDMQSALQPQVTALVESITLTSAEWQSSPLVVNLPGYAPAAAILLAELHGRTGHFPAILHLRLAEGHPAPTYDVASIINLQDVREKARGKR